MKYTAEFVSEKHPDKLCDQISDAIVDFCLMQDKDSRCAIETMGGHGKITITGEVTTNAKNLTLEAETIARQVAGFDYEVEVNLVVQSPEIARGVDDGGAGDQGIMIGYACRETSTLMPKEYELARSLNNFLFAIYKSDGKTQVTWDSEKDEVVCILASFQNAQTPEMIEHIKQWLETSQEPIALAENFKLIANPAGDWNIGGFDADAGVTGRKIVVDAYGPRIQVGGGAFSGKDATKVDRSAAYMARYIAIETLRNYPKAKECLVRVAYAIGLATPLELTITTDGQEVEVTEKTLEMFKPAAIIDFLNLKTPVYENTARGGHFGAGHRWG